MEISMVLGFPFPTRDSPLVVTPGFAVHYLDGPADVGLPPRLFDAYAEFRWLRRLTPQWGIDVAVTPGVFSDFQQSESQAMRITGHVVAAWTWTPTLTLVLGGTYLDRPDVPFLPVCGLTWTPNPDVKFDLVFPKPKISRRVYFCGACGAGRPGLGLHRRRVGRRDLGHRAGGRRRRRLQLSRHPRVSRRRAKVLSHDQSALRGGLRFRPQDHAGPGGERRSSSRHADAPRRIDLLSLGRCPHRAEDSPSPKPPLLKGERIARVAFARQSAILRLFPETDFP